MALSGGPIESLANLMLAPLDLANGRNEGAQRAVVHDRTNAPAGDMQRTNALACDLRIGACLLFREKSLWRELNPDVT
jgi:hypothetical protein